MQIIYYIIVFILGLLIGSFLNVLILRAKDDTLSTIFFTRSHCPKCQHTLAWYDLIPVASYLFLRGKCRYCKGKISIQYPIVELLSALLYLLLFSFFGLSIEFAIFAVIFSLLLAICVHDILTQYTPEILVWIALAVSLFGGWYLGNISFYSVLYGVLIGAGVPGLLVLISREKWMGAGDIKIGLILGIILGYPQAILGLFMAFVIGAVVGLVFIKLKDKTMKDSLPFAPFLILATLITLLWGDQILRWYLGSFFPGGI